MTPEHSEIPCCLRRDCLSIQQNVSLHPSQGSLRLHRGQPSKPMLQPLPQTLDLDLFSLITSRRATPLVSNRSLIVAYEKMTRLLTWSRQFPNEIMVAISVQSSSIHHEVHFGNDGPVSSKMDNRPCGGPVCSTGSRSDPIRMSSRVPPSQSRWWSSGTWAFKTVVYKPMGDITLGLHLGQNPAAYKPIFQ